MNTEQPYFVVKVEGCWECPHSVDDDRGEIGCDEAPWNDRRTIQKQNFSGITPTCPMWPQRVQEKKDE